MRYAFTVLALTVLWVPAGLGQTALTPQPVPGPVTYLGTYDLATQSFVPPSGADGGVVVYDNTGVSGSFFPSGPGFINMDWGTLAAAPNSKATDIQIGYATSSAVPVDIRVRVHEGANGFANFGTVVSDILITGLPGSSLPPGIEAFVFDIDLVANALTFNIADGDMGYSYETFDADTGALLAGPPFEAGVVDAFDQYFSDETYFGTFNFGGFPAAPAGSFHFQLTGTEPAECLLVFGDGPGNEAYDADGHSWQTQIDNITDSYEVLLTNTPTFVISDPNPVTTRGPHTSGGQGTIGSVPLEPSVAQEFTVQVVMWNPTAFPANPEQSSNGLAVKVMPNGRIFTIPFGETDGMEVWAEVGYDADGQRVISFPFSIEGM
jgi:hypothetical protein